MKKRILAAVLAFYMMTSLIPMTAFAVESNVAAIGAQEYATLQAAVDAAAGAGEQTTVVLLKDTDEAITVSRGDVVLDLAGFQLRDQQITEMAGTITVSGGELTVNDSSDASSGKVLGNKFAVVVRDGKLTINGGTFGRHPALDSLPLWNNPWMEPLFVGGGSCVINDGTFSNGAVEYFYYEDFNGSKDGSLVVNGGNYSELPINVAAGGAPVWAPGKVEGHLTAYPTMEAFVEENSTPFSYDAGTKTLTAVAEWSGIDNDVFFNGNFTLDLNSQTIDLNGNLLLVNAGVEVTIKDSGTGGVIKTHDETPIDTLGVLNLAGGQIEMEMTKNSGGGKAVVMVQDNGVFNMTGGAIVLDTKDNYYGYGITNTDFSESGTAGHINLSGGTVTIKESQSSSRSACIYLTTQETYVSVSEDAKLVVEGENASQYAIYHNSNLPSYVEITGGTINGKIYSPDWRPGDKTDYYHISGGQFKEDVVEQGYASKSTSITNTGDSDMPYQITPNTAETDGVVCSIDDRYYKSVQDALSELYDGDKVLLLAPASGALTVSKLLSFTIDANSFENTVNIQGEDGYLVSKQGNTYTVQGDLTNAEKLDLYVGGYFPYTGEEQTPSPNVSWNSITLKKDVDYTVSYENNINAGTDAVCIITGMGKYVGTAQKTFRIRQAFNEVSTPVIEGWTWGEIPNLPTATATFGQDEIEFGYNYGSGSGSYALTAPDRAGDWWVLARVRETNNYRYDQSSSVKFTIAKAAAPQLPDIAVSYKAGTAEAQTVELGGIPLDAGTVTLTFGSEDYSSVVQSVTGGDGKITVTLNSVGAEGSSVTIPVTVTMYNYIDAQFDLTVTLTGKENQVSPTAEMTIEPNADGETLTAAIAQVDGAEYSFDGISWSDQNTKTDIVSGQIVTGYIRIKETETHNASPAANITQKAPVLAVKMPTASPNGGSFSGSQTVELSCATDGSVIYYTTDGSEPTESSTQYTGSIIITETTTIKVIAVKDGMNNSDVLEITFTKSTGSGSVTTYAPTITDSKNGSITIRPSRPAAGATVTITTDPDEGYEVDEVTVTDQNDNEVEVTDNGDGTYSFTQPSSRVTITVTYALEKCDGTEADNCSSLAFSDLDTSLWYHEFVDYAIENGLMVGTGDKTFSPGLPVTRAQVVTVLWRLENMPQVNYAMAFEDVVDGQWYTEAVRWAASIDVVGGYSAEEYGTDDYISRQDMATILYRYAAYKGYDVSASDALDYSDAEDIRDYALTAMQWVCGAGIFEGNGDGTVNPLGDTKRCEYATIMMRFIETFAA